jgi:antitoxin CptB
MLSSQVESLGGSESRADRKQDMFAVQSNCEHVLHLPSAPQIATWPLIADTLLRGAVGCSRMGKMDRTARLNRLRFRAWHRGVREADLLIGGYFDRWHGGWTDEEMGWFEALLEEQDVDILAWAMGRAIVPERWRGEMMRRLQALDYVKLP